MARKEIYQNQLNIKLEVAVEVMAAKIAKLSNKGFSIESDEMKELLEERKQMYKGNEEIINKIINVYGPEIKKEYEGA